MFNNGLNKFGHFANFCDSYQIINDNLNHFIARSISCATLKSLINYNIDIDNQPFQPTNISTSTGKSLVISKKLMVLARTVQVSVKNSEHIKNGN